MDKLTDFVVLSGNHEHSAGEEGIVIITDKSEGRELITVKKEKMSNQQKVRSQCLIGKKGK